MSKDKRRSQSGFVSAELLIAISFSFVFLVFLLNLIAIQYGRGVIRAAADEGARAGSRVAVATTDDPTLAACQQKADDMLNSIGTMASNPQVTCVVDAGTQRITATVTATFDPWMPWVPTIDAKSTASSVKEQAPE